MPKDIGGLSGPLLIIQQAQPVCDRESIRLEHHPRGLGRYFMGTTKGNTTDDLQGSRQIDHRRTCLESKPTRHQPHKNPIHTERGSEDRYGMSQDVQYRSPTHGSKNAES